MIFSLSHNRVSNQFISLLFTSFKYSIIICKTLVVVFTCVAILIMDITAARIKALHAKESGSLCLQST